MKRWFNFFLFFVLTLFFGFASYLFAYRAEFLSTVLTKALQTPVKVDTISLNTAGVSLANLRIANPPGCTLKKAFSVQEIAVHISWLNLAKSLSGISSERIVIDEVRIQSPYVGVELFNITGSDNNWKRMMERLPPSQGESSRKFVVKKFIITEIQVEMLNKSLSNKPIKSPLIPKLELTNLGEEGALTTQELFTAAFALLLQEVGQNLKLQELGQGIKHLPRNIVKKTLQAPQEITNTILDHVDAAKDKIKDLFQNK